MLFKNTYNPSYKNTVSESDANWQSLAEWLGLSADDLQISGTKSLKEITVYTCIKILSETLGKLPLKIYQDSGGIRKATDHYLYHLLKLRPNPYMSAADFWKCLEVQRNIRGNSYAWMDISSSGRNAGNILGIYPLDSSKMQIYVDDIGLLSSKNSVWYVYTDKKGNQYKINSNELWHFKGMTIDGIAGLSAIEMLRNSIENAKAAGNFLNNSYKNGMQTAGIINYVGDLSPAAENKFRDKFEQMSSGLKNANRISLLPIGYKYEPMALKLTDAQFLENTRLTLQQLTAAFGIKPHQVNDQTKTSYASASEANREFHTDTLLSILTGYEQEITYKSFLDSELNKGTYAKFNADVILRGDIKTRYDAYAVGIQNGFKKPNEIRAMEEDMPADGGDQLIVNGNYIPLTMAGKQYDKGGTANG
ncbi:MAG: phage portal protein [Clostridiales bacterium GWF2_36_10]|nr:MAG: phage portal protein [Clostridiales bacterium GWF2_36_10]HAN20418.1 phage portal protein [Clostridiales bacterium]